jgi:hypothetical protein
VRSKGGRLKPPLTSTLTPSPTGRRARSAESILAASSALVTRTSMAASACSGTTLTRVPPLMVPTLSVVPGP